MQRTNASLTLPLTSGCVLMMSRACMGSLRELEQVWARRLMPGSSENGTGVVWFLRQLEELGERFEQEDSAAPTVMAGGLRDGGETWTSSGCSQPGALSLMIDAAG